MKRGKVTNRILDRYIGIPLLNTAACFKRKRPYPEALRRVGILLNPALGDTMLASGVVQDIRAAFPQVSLILFAAKPNLAAAKLLPGLDSIELLPITRPLAAVKVLRRSKLDLMFDFTSWQRVTALYTLLSGAKFTIGFRRDGQHRHRGYDAVVPHLGNCHELENMRRLARFVGALANSPPRLIVPEEPLPAVITQRADDLVVFHAWATGTYRPLREWPEENWIELGKRLHAPGRQLLLTGGPSDEHNCLQLQKKMAAAGVPVVVLIGRKGLGEVARVLQAARVLVTVNTGIMHLSAILGTSTVSLNGPTSEYRWGPVGTSTFNVPTSDGSGGFLDLGFEFDGQNVMPRITVDAVMAAVQMLQPDLRSDVVPVGNTDAMRSNEAVCVP